MNNNICVWKIIIYIFFILVNLFYGIYSSKKNKKVVIKINDKPLITINTLLIICLFLMYFINIKSSTNISDYESYKNYYKMSNNNIDVEMGYVFLEKIFKNVNISFDCFRIIILLFSLTLLYLGIKKLNINENIVFALYSIYPYTFDIIQLRNFLATSIIIFGIHYLLNERRIDSFKYIICVLVATLIHNLSLVYILLIVSNYRCTQKIRKQILVITFGSSLGISLIMKVFPNFMYTIQNLFFLFRKNKASYYTRDKINFGFVLFWLMELGYIFSSYNIRKNTYYVDKKDKFSKQLFWLNIAIACTFPLCLININFYRIYRNLAIINYSQLFFLIKYRKKNMTFACIIFFITFALNAYYNIQTNFDRAYLPFFLK